MVGPNVVAFGKFDGVHLGHRGLDGVEVGTVEVAGGAVSATRIRASLAHGTVELVGELLGRPYEVTGTLRVLDPSTATVTVAPARAIPAPGTYDGTLWARTSTRPMAAVIEVSAPAGGRHCLTARCQGAGFAGDRPSGRARLAFEKRAGAHGVHPDTPRGRT